jgi:hypothetical protein
VESGAAGTINSAHPVETKGNVRQFATGIIFEIRASTKTSLLDLRQV